MEHKNYYKTLGVESKASTEEIKAAYRRLARKYHPDVSKEPDAEARFKDVNEAYDVLSDPKKKQSYDNLNQSNKQKTNHRRGDAEFTPPPGWKSGNFDAEFFENIIRRDRGRRKNEGQGSPDFFDSIFSSRKRGQHNNDTPQVATIPLTLEDVYSGARRKVRLPNGRSIQVKIPQGLTEGQKIRIGNGPGRTELHLKVKIKPHPHFQLDNRDVLLKLPISPWEAALGSMITVPTLDGNVSLRIPEGVQTGKKMRLPGKGLPGKDAGDQIITLVVVTPPATTKEQRNLYRQMATEFAWDPRSGMI